MYKMLFLSKGIEAVPEIVNRENTIGFISTAGDCRKDPYFVKRTYRQLELWGYDIIDIPVSELSEEELAKKLAKTDALFIAGGNTYYLLQELNKKNFKELVSKRLNEGMLYIGESSGAIIACNDIAYIEPMDNPSKAPELTSTKGLELFPFPIIPHADHPRHGRIADEIAENTNNAICLNEDQAIFVKVNEKGNTIITPLSSMLGAGFKAEVKKYF